MKALFRRRAAAAPQAPASPWAGHRARARALRESYPHAAEVLTLYLGLLDVWEEAWHAAGSDPDLPPERLPEWAAGGRVFGKVVRVTAEVGPGPLAEAADSLRGADAEQVAPLLAAWLAGEELVPAERYFARATLRGPLEALGADAAHSFGSSPGAGSRCPDCGGPPQLSYRGDSGDRLVSGQRRLQCARCPQSWPFSASTCPGCGKASRTKRTIYTEKREKAAVGRAEAGGATFPHLRVEACRGCQRYLIDVNQGQDPRAVPEVDELAALPLDLHATEHGLSKLTPNLMGF